MELHDFTLEEFEAAIRQQEVPVVVNFWATWSVACLMNKEHLEAAVELCGSDAIFGYVDIDIQKELTDRFSIITIPTTFVFYQGQIAKQYMGIQEPEDVYAAVLGILGKPVPIRVKP